MLRLVALDGFRGVAAIAVVLFHVSGLYRQNFPFRHGLPGRRLLFPAVWFRHC